eukprot:TRINITY_DN5370_c0_g2_i1.p1 TRINITY_DN5370_c0_g2~~TRINITY_DN5370_c0_g2_i1.p1  ORF type:complete len:439 (+),score=78.63 TRINITY_DN5370_c0_g2_i1:48-1364(+)
MDVKATIRGVLSSKAEQDLGRKALSKTATKIEAQIDEISALCEKHDALIVERTARLSNTLQRLEALVLEKISQHTAYYNKQIQMAESQPLLQSSLSKKYIEQSKNPFNRWIHLSLIHTLPTILCGETLLPRYHIIATRLQSEISINKHIDFGALLSRWFDPFYYPIQRSLFSIKDPQLIRDCYGVGPGQFNGPWGVAVHPMTGEIYVADYSNHRIQVFTPEFEFIRTIGSRGNQNGEFFYPVAICFTPEGDLVVSEHMNHRIQKLRTDGTSLWTVGTLGNGNAQFCNHYGLTIDRHGFIYVSDWANGRIQKFSPDGAVLLIINMPDFVCLSNRPDGILVTENEELLSISANGKQLNVFSTDGTLIRSFPIEKLSGHSCMCRGPQGTFAISDRQGGNVFFYDYEGKHLHQIKFPETSGLAFAPDGRLYLSSMKNIIAIF